MKKVLLLNPPGKKLYIRCYYCSKVSKANYIPPPVDLVILSGILSKKYELYLLDAVIEKLTDEGCINKIKKINPDIIISLVGSVSWEEDITFFEKLNNDKKYQLVLSGDLLLKDSKQRLEKYPFLDAAILDFTTKDIISFLEKKYNKIKNITYRKDNKIIETKKEYEKGEFELPIPRHDLFKKYKYRMSFMKSSPIATVLTDFGCPYRCDFCIMPSLGFKYRSIKNVIEELKYINSIGIKEIYFPDQTFGALRKRNIELCKQIIKNDIKIDWCCFSRVDVLDYETLSLMKKAGCHTILFGVESANKKILEEYKKDYDLPKIKKTFSIAKKVGIKTMGTFLIGLPEEDEKSCLNTIKFAKDIGCDYASFSFAVPRVNTKLREKAINQGLISDDVECMDQSGSFIAMPTTKLTKKKITKLRRKAIISFYLRPKYILSQLKDINSFTELKNKSSEMFAILKGLF